MSFERLPGQCEAAKPQAPLVFRTDGRRGRLLDSCKGLRTDDEDGGCGESALEEAGQGDSNGRE